MRRATSAAEVEEARVEAPRAVDEDRCIVDEHVAAPEETPYLGEGTVGAFLIVDVELDDGDLQALLLELVGCGKALVGVARAHHRDQAGPRELAHDLETDAAVGAGDEGDARCCHEPSPRRRRP